jgi:hypothetical protein
MITRVENGLFQALGESPAKAARPKAAKKTPRKTVRKKRK